MVDSAQLREWVKTALRVQVFDLDRASIAAWLDAAEEAVRELQEDYGDWLSARLAPLDPDEAAS